MARIATLTYTQLLSQTERFREDYMSPHGVISFSNFSQVVSQVLPEKPEAVILTNDMFDEMQYPSTW